jgi:hypothetical protein
MNESDDEQRFVTSVLKCKYEAINRDQDEHIKGLGMTFPVYRHLNEQHYAAQRTDNIIPSDPKSVPAMLYANGTCAATAYQGADYRAFVMGFPFECIQQKKDREAIMRGILQFLIQYLKTK